MVGSLVTNRAHIERHLAVCGRMGIECHFPNTFSKPNDTQYVYRECPIKGKPKLPIWISQCIIGLDGDGRWKFSSLAMGVALFPHYFDWFSSNIIGEWPRDPKIL